MTRVLGLYLSKWRRLADDLCPSSFGPGFGLGVSFISHEGVGDGVAEAIENGRSVPVSVVGSR